MRSLLCALLAAGLLGCAGHLPIATAALASAPGSPPLRSVPQTGHGSPITAVALSADGRIAASAGGNVRFWHVETGTLLQTWSWFPVEEGSRGGQYGGDGDANDFVAVALTSDGARAVVATRRRLFLVDVASGATLGHYARSKDVEWKTVGLAPDGRTLLAVSDDGKLELLDVETWRLAGLLGRHMADRVAFLSDGRTVATIRERNSRKGYRAWDWRALKRVDVTPAMEAEARAVVDGRLVREGRRVEISGAELKLVDATSGAVLHRFRPAQPPADEVALSADGTRALVGRRTTGAVWYWNLESGSALPRLPVRTPAALSEDGRLVAAVEQRNGREAVAIVDPERGVVLHRLELPPGGDEAMVKAEAIGFLREAHAVVIVRPGPLRVLLWEYESGRTREDTYAQLGDAHAVSLARDSRTLVASSARGVTAIDLARGAVERAVASRAAEDPWALFPGSRYLATVGASEVPGFHYFDKLSQVARSVTVFDGQSGTPARLMPVSQAAGGALAFSPDGRLLAVGSGDGRVFLYETGTGSLVRTLQADSDRILALAFSADGRHLLVGGFGGAARWWPLEAGSPLLLLSDGDDWVIAGGEGDFDGSRGSPRLLSAVQGLVPYGLDQLALVRNRPDRLLSAAGLGAPEVRRLFQARYERRLREHGIDPGVVEQRLQNAPTVELSVGPPNGRSAEVTIDATGHGAEVVGVALAVNGVPVPASGALEGGGEARRRQRIELGVGPNRIEATALDARGVRSLAVEKVVEVSGPAPAPATLHFVGFGVSRYGERSLDLGFARADVESLAERLARERGFQATRITTFVDAEVTRAALARARQALERTSVDDVVVLLVAGHGAYAGDPVPRYYFLPHDVVPERIAETGIPLSEIEGVLDGIPARRRLLLMDTCESGERDDEEPVRGLAAPLVAVRSRPTRGLVHGGGASASRRPGRTWLLDRDRLIYDDLRRRAGAVVFSSSRGTEPSLELPTMRHGAFTKALLEALQTDRADADGDGDVSLQELRRFVAAEVQRTTGDQQHPTVDRDNPSVNVRFKLEGGGR